MQGAFMIFFDSQTEPESTKDYTLMDWFFYFIFGGIPPREN
jgi:hypothetical protein